MASLANCLRKHAKQLRPGDAEAIEKAAAAFEREGMSPSAAAERAVLEVMADEQRALRGFVEQVEAAGGTAPAWVGEAMAPRVAQAVPEKPAEPEPTPPATTAPESPAAPRRTVPTNGDLVFTYWRGFGGSAARVNGVVRGDRVAITGGGDMVGGRVTQKSVPLTADWTKVGEEHPSDRRLREQTEALKADEDRIRFEREKTLTDAQERNGTLDPAAVKVGDELEMPDGSIQVVGEIDASGRIYAHLKGKREDGNRFIGNDMRGIRKVEANATQPPATESPRVEAAAAEAAPEPTPAPDDGKIDDFGEKIGGARKDTARPTGARRAQADDEAGEGWRRRYEVSQVVKAGDPTLVGRWMVHDKRRKDHFGKPRAVGERNGYATREEADAAVPLIEVARNHRVVNDGTREADNWAIVRDINDRKRVRVKDGFASRLDAMRYMADNAAEIIDTRTTFGEESLPVPPLARREGPARRTGPSTPAMFMDTFGFRGVEFGLWNNQAERQEVMDHAFDGLADMAEILGVPPRALSLNGALGLAFGARGQGLVGAKAHYERDYAAINITKMKGAGSLAHEWLHALDHYLGRQDGKAARERRPNERGDLVFNASESPSADFASYGFLHTNSGVRAEVQAALKRVMETMFFREQVQGIDAVRVQRFLQTARDEVQKKLDGLRSAIATERRYGSRRRAATPDELAAYDRLASEILAGTSGELVTVSNPNARRGSFSYRTTNDALNGIEAILKAVVNRSGFNADKTGDLDRLAQMIRMYHVRIADVAKANEGGTQTTKVRTEFAREARELDQGRGQDYWTTEHEMLARAFSAYIEDRARDRGVVSEFLTYSPERAAILTPWGPKRPFPFGAERVAINEAFDNLFQVIEARQADDGTVGFYSIPAPGAASSRLSLSDRARIREAARTAESEYGVRINVVQNSSDPSVPARVRGQNPQAQGYTDGYAAWIFTDNLGSLAHAQAVMAHEVVGHVGVEPLVGPEEWQGIIDTVQGVLDGSIPSAADAGPANRAAALGPVERPAAVSEEVARIIREANERYPGASPRTLAREAVAVMAERGVKASMLDRLLAAMRRALRRVFKRLAWSDAELRDLIARSAEGLRRTAGEAAPRLQPDPVDAMAQGAADQPQVPAIIRTRADYNRYRRNYGLPNKALSPNGMPVFGKGPVEFVDDATGKVVARTEVDPADLTDDQFAQGTPDPSTERGAAELLRQVDAEGRRLASDRTIGQRIRDAIDTTRPGWYKLLSVAQVVEIGREVLPQAGTFGRMFREMGAWTNALMEPAALIAERWTELIGRDKEAAIRLGRLMHDATREQFDPDTQVPGDNRGRPGPGPLIEQRLAREWAALPDDAKAIYRDVRDLYAKRRDLTMEALIDRVQQAINAGRAKAATLAAIRAHFEAAKLKGPYFPLGRFGDYWIRARKGENGAPEFFMYETAGQWRTAMDELARDGYTIEKSGKKIRELRADEGPGAGFMGDLVGILDAAAEDDLAPLIDRQAAEALKDSVWQLYLESLPELSLRKSSLHRKGTLGFSQDALRVFSHHMTHGARQLGRLRFGHRLADLVRQMRDTADETRDPAKSADVTKYLDEAYQWAMNPTGSHFATKLTSLGFLWHLGVSPAAALVNVMQNVTVAYPVLGARFGFDRSGAALLKASRDYLGTVSGSDQATSNRDQLDAEFDGDLGRALADLEASGIIDRTQTMALTGLGEDRAQLSVVQAKVMNVVGWAFHQAEKFNRETTAIAAYRLARQSGMTHEAANEYAYTAVVRSHYDYSNANRPPIFRSDWAKVLFLFKQYAQNTIYLLARNVHQATRAESAEVRTQARRELAGILGMTFAVGGMAALPLYTPMMWFLSTVVALFGGGDDDQPWDAEREFRAWLAKHLGKFGGEVVARGLVNASDTIDLSSRIGLDDVLVRWPDRPMDGKELAMHYLEQAAGPVIGIGMSWFRALDQMASGDVGRGIETAVPKAIRDVVKAIRYQVDDDALNLSGQPIIEDVSLIESAVQAAGFTPARLAQAYERASAAKRVEDKTLKRRTELLAAFYTASREQDSRKRAEALAEAVGAVAAWNATNPDWPITADAVRASVRARYAAGERNVDGQYLNPTVARRLQQEPY